MSILSTHNSQSITVPSFWFSTLDQALKTEYSDTSVFWGETSTPVIANQVLLNWLEAGIARVYCQTGRIDFILQAVQSVNPLELGAAGVCMHSAANLNQMLDVLVDSFVLFHPLLKLHKELLPDGGAELWVMDREGFSSESQASVIALIYYLCFILQLIRNCTGKFEHEFNLGILKFRVDEARLKRESKSIKCSVTGNHPVRRIIFTAEELAFSTLYGNSALYNATHALLQLKINEVEQNVVSLALMKYMEKTDIRHISLSSAAKALNLSQRTLARRLNEEGVSFKSIFERYKLEQALKMFNGSKANVTTIAYTLGYSDTSSFSRAFRRWTGQSPMESAERDRLITTIT